MPVLKGLPFNYLLQKGIIKTSLSHNYKSCLFSAVKLHNIFELTSVFLQKI